MTIRVSDKDLMEQLRSGPEGQRLLKEREEALLEERRTAAAELVELRKELDEGLPGHDAALEKAKERFQKAHAARMAALQDVATVDRERGVFAKHHEARIGALEVVLRRTAPREIAEFIGGWAPVDSPQARAPGLVTTTPTYSGLEKEIRDLQDAPLTEWRHPTKGVWKNNQAQLSARFRALRAAQAKAALLMFEALTPEEVKKRLQAIRAEIPSL